MTLTNKNNEKKPLLVVKDFALSFRVYKKGLREQQTQVIHKLNMEIYEGEVVAVVGASGSGKSLLADAILGILPENALTDGEIYYKGEHLFGERQKQLRGKAISLIPQSVNALNPLMKVGKQVQTTLKKNNSSRKSLQREVFQKVNLKAEVDHYYPFELSGGMVRRVLSAIALIGNPELIIADEPTPGLDEQSLQEVTSYIRSLADDGKGVMFITHDIDTALTVADRFVIMNEGETVETVDAVHFTGKGEGLKHGYTKALWNALPSNEFIASPMFQNRKELAQSNNDEAILRVKDVSYKIDSQVLMENVNFTLRPGEIVGLMGESGAGKTTLAKIIAGYNQPDRGSIQIDGHIVNQAWNPVQLVWQHPEQSINPKWKMDQVLKESNMLDSDITKFLGIREEWFSRWPSELSGGELQRFSIARALSPKTKFLILDEITTMLDAITQAQIWQVILELIEKQKIGVLAISHDEQLLKRISNRILDYHQLSR